jgi:hypothetical protein
MEDRYVIGYGKPSNLRRMFRSTLQDWQGETAGRLLAVFVAHPWPETCDAGYHVSTPALNLVEDDDHVAATIRLTFSVSHTLRLSNLLQSHSQWLNLDCFLCRSRR